MKWVNVIMQQHRSTQPLEKEGTTHLWKIYYVKSTTMVGRMYHLSLSSTMVGKMYHSSLVYGEVCYYSLHAQRHMWWGNNVNWDGVISL